MSIKNILELNNMATWQRIAERAEQALEELKKEHEKCIEHLREMVVQADEDCPSEYRSDHFRSAMEDSISFIRKSDNKKA